MTFPRADYQPARRLIPTMRVVVESFLGLVGIFLVVGAAYSQTVSGTEGSSGGGSLTCSAGQVVNGASCTATPTLGASGTLGSLTMGNATSGTLTLEPVTGALGAVTVSIPAATDTLINLASTQTLSNKTLASPTITGTVTGVTSNWSGTVGVGLSTLGTGASQQINGSMAIAANSSFGRIINPTILFPDYVFGGPVSPVTNPDVLGIAVEYNSSAALIGHALDATVVISATANPGGSASGVNGGVYSYCAGCDSGGVLGQIANDTTVTNGGGAAVWGITRIAANYSGGGIISNTSDSVRATSEVTSGNPRSYFFGAALTGNAPAVGMYLQQSQFAGVQVGGPIVGAGFPGSGGTAPTYSFIGYGTSDTTPNFTVDGGTGDILYTGAAWSQYTPTITAGTGTITGATIASEVRYKVFGKTVVVDGTVIITNVGSGSPSGSLGVSLPASGPTTAASTSSAQGITNAATAVNGLLAATGTNWVFYTYSGGSLWSNDMEFSFSTIYESD